MPLDSFFLYSFLRKCVENRLSFILAHVQEWAAEELLALQEVSAMVVSYVVEREHQGDIMCWGAMCYKAVVLLALVSSKP